MGRFRIEGFEIMKVFSCFGVAAVLAVSFISAPTLAQESVCTEGVCTLVPPGEAAAPTPGLVIREIKPGDVCFSEGDQEWVPPDSVTDATAAAAGPAGPGNVCYNEGDQTWVIPRR